MNLTTPQKLLILFVVWLLLNGSGGLVSPSQKPTAVVLTYDDKQHAIPPPVSAALNTLNRQGIKATLDEVDTTDGTGDVPSQYQVSRPAAVAAGLPALVVMAGERVLRVVKDPRTDAQVLEAAR